MRACAHVESVRALAQGARRALSARRRALIEELAPFDQSALFDLFALLDQLAPFDQFALFDPAARSGAGSARSVAAGAAGPAGRRRRHSFTFPRSDVSYSSHIKIGTVPTARTTTAQKCEAIPRRGRV